MKNTFWKGRSVLVTGATGIVGSWLVKSLLAQGSHVTAFILDSDPQSELLRSGDIQRISVVNGALEDFSAIERAILLQETEVIFHLGAQTLVQAAQAAPLATFEANIRGTYNLLEASRRHARTVKRVVIASSDKAYGEAKKLPYVETLPLEGRFPYEVSKSCADLLTQSYFHSYGLPVAIARCGNIYGGGDLNWSRIVPGTIRSLLRGERPVLRSDGSFVRDYFYVKDAVNAYLCLAEQLTDPHILGQAFNFSTEKRLTVLKLVQEIQKAVGQETLKPLILNKAPGEIHDQYLSAAKAHRILNWKPLFDLQEGLRETVSWYRTLLKGTLHD